VRAEQTSARMRAAVLRSPCMTHASASLASSMALFDSMAEPSAEAMVVERASVVRRLMCPPPQSGLGVRSQCSPTLSSAPVFCCSDADRTTEQRFAVVYLPARFEARADDAGPRVARSPRRARGRVDGPEIARQGVPALSWAWLGEEDRRQHSNRSRTTISMCYPKHQAAGRHLSIRPGGHGGPLAFTATVVSGRATGPHQSPDKLCCTSQIVTAPLGRLSPDVSCWSIPRLLEENRAGAKDNGAEPSDF
jgi:hypothetical protein